MILDRGRHEAECVERMVDLTSHQFDVGGRVELLYGGDARFIHSNGILDSQDFFRGPELQFDVPQVYVDVAVPLGNGVRVRAGKFLFFKQIDPNASVFYSHSYTFGAALPFNRAYLPPGTAAPPVALVAASSWSAVRPTVTVPSGLPRTPVRAT